MDEIRRRASHPAYATFKKDMLEIAETRPDELGNASFEQVWWWLPEIAMSWLVTEQRALATKVRNYVLNLTDRPDWGGESGGAHENSYGLMAVGVAYDWAYELFDNAERRQIRDKIRLQVDKLYRAFYDPSAGSDAYWKQDYQANHHRNRVGGLTIGAAAIYGDGADDPSEAARLAYARVQLLESAAWINPDGTQHDGQPAYVSYGDEHLVRAIDVYENITGESLWNESIHNMGDAEIHFTLPKLYNMFMHGNGGGRHKPDQPQNLAFFNHYLWRIASKFEDGQLQRFLTDVYRTSPGGRESFIYNAWNLLWYDASLEPEPYDSLPTAKHFTTLDVAAMRSGWTADDIALHFKCGPIGGHWLNKWRDRLGPNATYFNAAHNHPDAGHFSLSFGGYMWGVNADYQQAWSKYHNTIAVGADDVGQAGERTGYFQPYEDMRDRASITEFFSASADVITVGEAAKAYQAPSTAGLERFNRHVLFVGGRYAVIVDDVAAAAANDLHFLYHCRGDVAGNQASGWTVTQKPVPDNGADGRKPETLELYLPAIDGTKATVSPADHEVQGNTWRLTASSASSACFVAVLYPQREGESLQAGPPTVNRSGGVTRVTIAHADGSTDRIGVVIDGSESAALRAGDEPESAITATAKVLLASSDANGEVTTATAVAATELNVSGAKRQTSTEPTNLRWSHS